MPGVVVPSVGSIAFPCLIRSASSGAVEADIGRARILRGAIRLEVLLRFLIRRAVPGTRYV